MTTRVFVALVLAICLLAPLMAEESPYSGLETREIKALSEQQVAGYLGGKGMGLALSAELNGYPGPKHVLELAGQLELSPAQLEEVRGVFEVMQSQAISIGQRIVKAEGSLDALFANGSVESESLKTATAEIGLLQGQLRAVHLQAHLETKVLLTTHQVHKYVPATRVFRLGALGHGTPRRWPLRRA